MNNSRKVYSTDLGKLCPDCEQAIDACICSQSVMFRGDGIIRLSRETKGRKGKGVTLVSGVSGSEEEIKILAKMLKQKCNCGGSVKNGVIEIQGDQRELIKKILEAQQFKVKLAGG